MARRGRSGGFASRHTGTGKRKYETMNKRAIALAILLLGGVFVWQFITTTNQGESSESSANLVACVEPRPQICTQEYVPVCANLADGSTKTYASGCAACSDANVTGYEPEACD